MCRPSGPSEPRPLTYSPKMTVLLNPSVTERKLTGALKLRGFTFAPQVFRECLPGK